MKRFIIALLIMIGSVNFFLFDGYSAIESAYNHVPSKTCVYVVNEDFQVIRFANCEQEIPAYMKRQMDLIVRIDSVRYYMID